MWSNSPETLCRKHLLGLHGEIHKFRHAFVKKLNMTKRMELNQIDPTKMKQQHDACAKEMLRRGYKHNSPYEQPDISYLPVMEIELMDSRTRCEECKKQEQDNE
jgi:hypothetical protein